MKLKWSIDKCDETGLKGWMMDENAPESSIPIDIFVDEKFLCTTIADIFRADLLAAGLGNGKHGFNVIISNEFYDDKKHKFNLGYNGSLISEAVATLFLHKMPSVIKGYIDASFTNNQISGWVINENDLINPVKIDVFIDDELVTRVTANLFRQDVLDAKIGHGNSGFNVIISDKFWDGMEHSVNVYETVTKTVLIGCPKKFKIVD